MTNEYLEQYNKNLETIAKGVPVVRVLELDIEEGQEYAKCEYCNKKKPAVQIARNWGICDRDAQYGHI